MEFSLFTLRRANLRRYQGYDQQVSSCSCRSTPLTGRTTLDCLMDTNEHAMSHAAEAVFCIVDKCDKSTCLTNKTSLPIPRHSNVKLSTFIRTYSGATHLWKQSHTYWRRISRLHEHLVSGAHANLRVLGGGVVGKVAAENCAYTLQGGWLDQAIRAYNSMSTSSVDALSPQQISSSGAITCHGKGSAEKGTKTCTSATLNDPAMMQHFSAPSGRRLHHSSSTGTVHRSNAGAWVRERSQDPLCKILSVFASRDQHVARSMPQRPQMLPMRTMRARKNTQPRTKRSFR